MSLPCKDVKSFFAPQGEAFAREIVTEVAIGFPVLSTDTDIALFQQGLKAVWDTGAMGTSISKSLAEKLNLDKIGEVEIQGVTGSAFCSKYLVSLILPNNILIHELEVSDCEGNIGCDVLIGMDVIAMGDFVINNVGETTFSFRMPSIKREDYTLEES